MTLDRPFGRYTLLERIGVGGMAEIFRASTHGPGDFEMEVCIKRILPHCSEDPTFVAMFVDEARVVARLRHANIVQILDFNEVDGTYYIAMVLIEGSDLRKLLRALAQRGERLDPARAALIAAEICRGLHYAHTRRDQGRPMGIVHRDVSPHNVLLSFAGEVKVSDFGIAKATTRSSRTGTGHVKGKLAYMSPEQATGSTVDARTDQFATGLVLFEMLGGRRAYQGDADVEVLQQVCEGSVPSLIETWPDAPPALAEIVRRATVVEPAERFADMAAMESALRRVIYDLAPEPDALELGGLLRRLFDHDQRERPPTELLDAVADLPPFDEEASAGQGDVFQQPAADLPSDAVTQDSTRPGQVASAAATASLPDNATTRSFDAPLDASPPSVVSLPASRSSRRGLVFTGAVGALGLLGLVVALVVASRPEPDAGSTLPPAIGTAPSRQADAAATPTEPSVTVAEQDTLAAAAELDAGGGDAVGVQPRAAVAQPAPADAPRRSAVKTGRVQVNVVGSWAEVHHGGRRIGTTPIEIALPVGKRRLRLYNPETRAERTVTVQVPAEGVARVDAKLRGPR